MKMLSPATRSRSAAAVLADEFDALLGKLAATTRQLTDVSYRAGRAEVTEGSLHNIGNALNSLLASVDASRARLKAGAHAKIEQAATELAAVDSLTERQSKLAQYAALAAADAAKRFEALRVDLDRVLLHVNRIEDILESQRRLGADGDLAVACELLSLVETAVSGLPEIAERVVIRIDTSVGRQPPVLCVPSVVVQVLGNLLANAVKAIERWTPTRGLIEIAASTVEVEGVHMVDLSVTDNGVGLGVEEPVKIFQRHYTTKRDRGHGIDLHWSANMVTSMGGQLSATSEGKGKGDSLHFRVPVAP